MEELAPVHSVVVLAQNGLDLGRGEVDVVKVTLPSEVNAEDFLILGWAERSVVLLHTANLCDLHVVAERLSLGVDVGHSLWHILVPYKELGLDLVSCRRGRLIGQEMIDFLVPHTEA